MVDRLISARSSRVVAFARALLASFLLLSVTVGTLKYDEAQRAAKIVLIAYFAYSLLILGGLHTLWWRRQLFGAALVLAIIDVVALGGLLYLTQGPNPPFFTPLIFIILSGTIQWGSRGAILAGLLVLALYLPSGAMVRVFEDNNRDLLQLYLVRIGYIGVITVSLAAFASNLERLINELTRLSRVPTRGGFGELPLTASLGYAMDVFAARHGLVVWQDPEEPHLTIVRKDAGLLSASSLANVDHGPLVASELINAPFLYDCRRGAALYRTGTRLKDFSGEPFRPGLEGVADYERVLVIPIEAGNARGFVMILDPADPVNEDLAVAAMVAGQVSLTIESWQLHSELRVAAASEERVRLARDLHDGVLQFLAGARLQLEIVSRSDLPEAARERTQQLIEAIGEEQRSLRQVVNAMRRTPDLEQTTLTASLRQLALHLSRSWDVSVEAEVEPSDLSLSAGVEDEIVRIMREAVANAVRHGGARVVKLIARQEGESLRVVISDDGRGFPLKGRMGNEELASYAGRPRSLYDRVLGMGGTMALVSGDAGARLEIRLPLRGRK